MKDSKQFSSLCALIGAAVLSAELWSAFFFAPPLRQMVIDLPLPSGADLNSWVQAARRVPELGSRRPPSIVRPDAPVALPAP